MSTQTVTIRVFPSSAYINNMPVISTSSALGAHNNVLTTSDAMKKLPDKNAQGDYTVIRKKQRVTPLGESNANGNIIATSTVINSPMGVRKAATPTASMPAKKQRVTHQTPVRNAENIAPVPPTLKPTPQQRVATSAKLSATSAAAMLPVSVARRNARERNRVKQVNNGFSALRDRIPDEVAEIFESHGTGRGSVKKLSKVETLRMAVEYIRSLEQCLVDDGVVLPEPAEMPEYFDFSGGVAGGNDTGDFNGNTSCNNHNASLGGSSPLQAVHSPDADGLEETLTALDEEAEEAAAAAAEASFLDTSSSTGSSGVGLVGASLANGSQEFIRLPAGGTFQISTPIYERDENGGLLQHQYAGIPILDAATGFMHHPQHQTPQQQPQHNRMLHQQLQLQQNMMNIMSPAASISPNSYAAASSPSPMASIKTEECYVILPPQHHQAMLQQQQQQEFQQQLSPNGTTTVQMGADGTVYYATMAEDSMSPVPAMYALKTELSDDGGEELLLSEQEQADSMIGSSLEWWQRTDVQLLQQQQQQQQQQPGN